MEWARLPELPKEKETLGADRVYLINLRRRPDRRVKMEECFRELGVDYELVEAVDGKNLTSDSVRDDGLRVLPGYVEPYSKREELTFGEIGCFLSHHKVRAKAINCSAALCRRHFLFLFSQCLLGCLLCGCWAGLIAREKMLLQDITSVCKLADYGG